MSANKPRTAYCTGCGITFSKMHLMIYHRNQRHCGGRFLPERERAMIDKLRLEREALLRRIQTEDST